jgi:hypothetical protein
MEACKLEKGMYYVCIEKSKEPGQRGNVRMASNRRKSGRHIPCDRKSELTAQHTNNCYDTFRIRSCACSGHSEDSHRYFFARHFQEAQRLPQQHKGRDYVLPICFNCVKLSLVTVVNFNGCINRLFIMLVMRAPFTCDSLAMRLQRALSVERCCSMPECLRIAVANPYIS